MPAPRRFTLEQEIYIARVAHRARRYKIACKIICARFDIGRTKLYAIMATYPAEKSVREQNKAGHLRVIDGYAGRKQAIG